ncbi:hypothetical protein [Bacillus sp. PS06]|uniref:hypothetical protein n=1 Tax=Bacillus sp. PS06 TaxID=2764176 RepID=UPI00296EF22A|nr:hypothetical protein [Bacillus sp. PS06]
MMEWTLAILLGVAVLLLIISVLKTRQSSKEEHREIDMVHISMMNELTQLKDQIRNIELDAEITLREAGLQITLKERLALREMLDLYKRGYSIESIAAEKKLAINEAEQLLSPYLTSKDDERRTVDHES